MRDSAYVYRELDEQSAGKWAVGEFGEGRIISRVPLPVKKLPPALLHYSMITKSSNERIEKEVEDENASTEQSVHTFG